MIERPDRISSSDRIFYIGFALYVLGGLFVLVQGLVAVVASASSSFHELLHVEGLGSGPLSRVALRAADAAHSVPSGVQIAIDYAFSLLNMALAAVLIWLRPRDWPARLLAVALVGAAGIFNLTSQAVLEELSLYHASKPLPRRPPTSLPGLPMSMPCCSSPTGNPFPGGGRSWWFPSTSR